MISQKFGEEKSSLVIVSFKHFLSNLREIKYKSQKQKINEFNSFIDNLKNIILEKSKDYFNPLKNLPLYYGFSGVNIFKIFGIPNNEDPISYFLSWLLDPNGSHGMGKMFLKRFIEFCKEIWQSEDEFRLENVKVNCQKDFSMPDGENGILDIEIYSEGEFLCIIENKLGARFSEEQFKRYSRYAESRCKQLQIDKTNVFLVALKPDSNSFPARSYGFKEINYTYIVKILQELREKLPSQGIVWVLLSQFLHCARIYKGNQNIFWELDKISKLKAQIEVCKNDRERDEILVNMYSQLKALNSSLKMKEVI